MEINMIHENAINHIDYYKHIDKRDKLFPIVSKKDILNNYSCFLTDNNEKIMREDILKQLSDRSIKCNISYNELSQIGKYIIEETTGTSGFPLRVVKSISERAILGLDLYRCRKEVDNKFEVNLFRAFNHTTLRQHNPKPYDYNEKHVINTYKELVKDKIRWLHTSVVPIKKHIDILKKQGFEEFPDLRFIELTGNFLEKEDVESIENFFSAKVINLYGCMETWAIAYGASYDCLNIRENVVQVEIVDDDGEVITEYDKYGNILVTSLVCNTMPIIRYRTGDIGKIIIKDGKKRLILKEGRNNQYIKGLDHKILGTKQFGNIIKMTLQKSNINDIDFIQFIQREMDLIEIKICYFEEIDTFIPALLKMIDERLNKVFRYEITIIEKDKVFSKENSKQELFICNI